MEITENNLSKIELTIYNPNLQEALFNTNTANVSYIETQINDSECSIGIGIERKIQILGMKTNLDGKWNIAAIAIAA